MVELSGEFILIPSFLSKRQRVVDKELFQGRQLTTSSEFRRRLDKVLCIRAEIPKLNNILVHGLQRPRGRVG